MTAVCLCGCGGLPTKGSFFLRGHNRRVSFAAPVSLGGACACGCGERVDRPTATYLRGHFRRTLSRRPDGTKRCPSCSEWKPETADYWNRSRGKFNGLNSYCKACSSARGDAWLADAENADKRRRWNTEWARAYRQRPDRKQDRAAIAKRAHLKLKQEMLSAYGAACSCCGEREPRFLTLEHVGNTGGAHRKALRTGGGNAVWRDLKRRGWPQDGFTLHCWNCNMAKAHGEPCPHELRCEAVA